MNEMRKLMDVAEMYADARASATINRFVVRHKSGAYVSLFNFGDNNNIANAKLFTNPESAKYHVTKLSSEWKVVPVRVTIEE